MKPIETADELYEEFDDVLDTLNRLVEYRGHSTVKDVDDDVQECAQQLHKCLVYLSEKPPDDILEVVYEF